MDDKKTIRVIASLQFPALHRWPEAPESVAFLRDRHRHVFHIRVWKRVSHQDREVEIISLKDEVDWYLFNLSGDRLHDFGSMSCEDIASSLGKRFDLDRCEVLEDGENGAEVSRAKEE